MASRNPIQNNGPAETQARLSFELPFVGREREISQLGALHAERKHALIIGPAGVGKNVSRLAAQWRERVAAGIRELTGEAERLALGERSLPCLSILRLRGSM